MTNSMTGHTDAGDLKAQSGGYTIWQGRRSGAMLAAACALAFALAGCQSGGLLGDAGTPAETQLVQTPPAKPAAVATRVGMAPVIGAPDGVAKKLAQDFTTAAGGKNVVVVPAQDKADYTLRGYVVAVKDKANVKVSYIWDVTDTAGRRVNRITGEEVTTAAAGADVWANLTPQMSQSIGQKSADSLSSWLASQTPAAAAVASAPPAPAGAVAVAPTTVSALPPATAAATPAPPAVSMALAAFVPSLSGAPGDGNNALAKALQTELSKNGVTASQQATAAYKVEGVVKMGQAADGKQPVQIDWNVKDPQGKRLGTVTQKNEISPGSLDSTWGRTADAAAAAAAQGILKLLPRATASN